LLAALLKVVDFAVRPGTFDGSQGFEDRSMLPTTFGPIAATPQHGFGCIHGRVVCTFESRIKRYLLDLSILDVTVNEAK